jgi:hypothetical protein
MGTRARVNIFDGNQILVSIYRQLDGYPEGLGKDVAEFAANMPITNGISGPRTLGASANGIGCFAAQLIKHLKEEVGNVYLRTTDAESHGEEYSYNVREKDGKFWIDVLSGSMTMFGMPGDTEAEMKPIFSGFASDFKVPADTDDE